jgi:uncharacterized protein YcfJ
MLSSRTLPRWFFYALTGLAGSVGAVQYASAGYDQTEDFARVLNSRPIYRSVEERVPQQHCWTESVREESHGNSPAGAIVGGVVGGALGHAVGHGSGNKKIGTALGVVLGATVGNEVSKNRAEADDGSYRERERCQDSSRTEHHEEIIGYDVDYQYQGRTYSTRMDHQPGSRIRVAVRVEPLE